MRFSIITVTATLFILMMGCVESKKLKNESLKPYPLQLDLGFHHQIFHHSPTNSTLYLQSYAMEYRVTVRVYDSFRSKNMVYEHTQQVVGDANSVQAIPVPVSLQEYALEILLFSPSDNQSYSDAVIVNKKQVTNQTLLAFNEAEQPILKKYYSIGKSVQFKTMTEQSTVFVRYFDEDYKPAAPAHISQNLVFNPDKGSKKIFVIAKDEYLKLSKKGLYFAQIDTFSSDGIFLNAVDDNFPQLTDADDLTLSVRYITKNDEYQRLTSPNVDTKIELDRFWLARAGEKERAKGLIRLYYNRIQLANEYFTSYKAGWKTDQGIVFTIFGSPTRVQKTENYEYWYYRRTSNRDFVEFIFDKRNGVYVLRRSPVFAQPWGAEIFAWRSGNVI